MSQFTFASREYFLTSVLHRPVRQPPAQVIQEHGLRRSPFAPGMRHRLSSRTGQYASSAACAFPP